MSPPFCTLPLTNLVFVDPHVRHRPLIIHLLFLLTTFRGFDVDVVFLHRTQYDACFMFRVRAILKGLHRGHHLLFANVCELRLYGKHFRSQMTLLVLFGFQVNQQIAIRSTGSILIGFYRKLLRVRIHLAGQRRELGGISWIFKQHQIVGVETDRSFLFLSNKF